MGFRFQKMEDEKVLCHKSLFHYHSLFEFDSIEFFEDETLVIVAYRIYLYWLDQGPNLK